MVYFLAPIVAASTFPVGLYLASYGSNLAANATANLIGIPLPRAKDSEKVASVHYPFPPYKLFPINQKDTRPTISTGTGTVVSTVTLAVMFALGWKRNPLIRRLRNLNIGEKGDGKTIENFGQFAAVTIPPLAAIYTNFFISCVFAGSLSPFFDKNEKRK